FEIQEGRKVPSGKSSVDAEVHIFGSKIDTLEKTAPLEQQIFGSDIAHWQNALIGQRSHEIIFIQTHRAPVWVVRPKLKVSAKRLPSMGSGAQSSYAVLRDRLGALWPSLRDSPGTKHLGITFHGCTREEVMASLLGLELGSYRFSQVSKGGNPKPGYKVSLFGASAAEQRAAVVMGRSMNMARHLVNLDADKLNPLTYAEGVLRWFHNRQGISIDIWGPKRLLEERMHLHAAVGRGAPEGSHMVHIKYRPKGKPRFKSPIAIVGKGVTFDTGGLDMKPASGMRLMKKDMGGSASVVGLANWLSESESDVACDLYIALAENSVDAHSFHPGDVLTARSGVTVEIHNTDAEGRLVMADVMDVAQTVGDKPLALIDLSTLTGAMRVAVGAEIAGFFSNHDRLADLAEGYGAETGDPCWRLPLWESYRGQLRSSFADMANASDSGFAGAITAALFLQKFIKGDLPWLHFDLYCWAERGSGAFSDAGGNGQGIQLLAALLDGLTAKDFEQN
ncbi:MAG: leucyl aminopeptidase family protein, partial [Proteobacteria bacterium]|nr:leucyl aminopeptidase family protein [Pseudomonadota bacterium]